VTRRVVIRAPAARDLDEQADYLAERSLDASLRFSQAVADAFLQLAGMPGIGGPHHFPNPKLQGIRCFRVPGFVKHLIFYQFDDESLTILRVLHGARDIPNVFEEDTGPDE
jgi:toxin ParE1/3/4